MFDQSHSPNDRSKFLEAARAAREERERDRRVTQAVTTIPVCLYFANCLHYLPCLFDRLLIFFYFLNESILGLS